MSRVLVIEDEKKLLDSLRRGLSQEGYDITTATTGEEGYYLATTETFDAILLDWMLPGRDGMRVLSDLRSKGVAGTGIEAPALGKPHPLRVVAVGDHIQAYLNETLLIDHHDQTFASGRVGLWTKADAVTEFSHFVATGKVANPPERNTDNSSPSETN